MTQASLIRVYRDCEILAGKHELAIENNGEIFSVMNKDHKKDSTNHCIFETFNNVEEVIAYLTGIDVAMTKLSKPCIETGL